MVSEFQAMVLAEGHKHTMALDQSALLEVLEALKVAEVDDRVRQAAETIYQALIEAELSAVIGAVPHERTAARSGHRNGHRLRTLSSTAGDLELRIPKLRAGSFFPSLLERRRRVDQSLFAVIMEAYLHGTSTRKVDDLVKALGADSGISRSEVSRICADLDTEVAAFRDRSLAAQRFPYVFLDATYCKARVDHRVVSQAVVIATGVAADGHREVLGFEVGDSEDGAFWTAFLRSLKTRGLAGVQLVISDDHEGLKTAIARVLASAWQRCTVHFVRDMLYHCRRDQRGLVAAALREVFNAENQGQARERIGHVIARLEVLVPFRVELVELGQEREELSDCRVDTAIDAPAGESFGDIPLDVVRQERQESIHVSHGVVQLPDESDLRRIRHANSFVGVD